MAHIFRRPRPGAARLFAYIALFAGVAITLNAWIFTAGGAQWASDLTNPSWAPPGAVIGAVWTAIFTAMAGALWAVDRFGDPGRRSGARGLIYAQFAINMSWTGFYFGLHSLAAGFWIALAAWILSLATTRAAFASSRLAGALMTPLTVWLSFSVPLSYAVWRMNA